jgi:hypothetical protein
MAKLLITTQVYENYAWNEDGSLGTGDKAYWKAKGGSDYVVKNVNECDMIDVIVDRVRGQVECDNDGFREYIIGYRVVADDYLTEFEQSQLEYEGKITYPAQVIVVDMATV